MENWIKVKFIQDNTIVEIKQAATGTEYFVDKEGNAYNITELDFNSDDIPQESTNKIDQHIKNIQELVKPFDYSKQEAYRAKLSEIDFWRRFRGEVFLTLLRIQGTRWQNAIEDTDTICNNLKSQDTDFINNNFK